MHILATFRKNYKLERLRLSKKFRCQAGFAPGGGEFVC
ncbi:hypothetical protein LEP1GSC194_0642 [Leptospira alstonii serovar Sichuan str. 79601]|uniref:Uncharacterized protein n=1 Tax=Leptospira alstonii serovar Sichuan str. 79601 TaxID=1218565 RepID=M6CI00_9LEPT|nr:hypothetical protein LEP1GSC194_0642 [Leptospira alstonii serovar Sichuan str. 79601]